MPPAKTEVAQQFSESCAAEVALQHLFFCSAEIISTKSSAAASEKLHCDIEKAALQESGAFLPLSCGFQAPTFRDLRLGPAEHRLARMSAGQTGHFHAQTGHVHGMVAVQKWGCHAEVLYVYWFFSSNYYENKSLRLLSRNFGGQERQTFSRNDA